MNKATRQLDRYLARRAVDVPEVDTLPAPDPALRTSVVIPVYDELEALPGVIESLGEASESPRSFEVIVVVNHVAGASADKVRANRETLRWLRGARRWGVAVHAVDRCMPGREYSPGASGVGRARREGCDLAMHRLRAVGRAERGLIANLDGDSPVAPGYIDHLHAEFDAAPGMLAGVCRYRHPVPDDEAHAEAIVAYETWMRYFAAALRWTGTPYAFQSIGSCMVLSARGYALADGMPQLEALSDFYMLQKVAKVAGAGAVRQLVGPRVYPSARPSVRVPRGTGPSVIKRMGGQGDKFDFVEPPRAFEALRRFFAAVPEGFSAPARLEEAAGGDELRDFLAEQDAWRIFEKLREHAPTPAHFERQFHTWFDSLKIVKFANAARRARGGVWIMDALEVILGDRAHALGVELARVGAAEATLADRRAALEVLREHEVALAEGRNLER